MQKQAKANAIIGFIVFIFVLWMASSASAHAQLMAKPLKYIDEVIEIAEKVSGRTLSSSLRKQAVEKLKLGFTNYGDDAIRRAVKDGGLELVEAASKYGDDVWKYSRNVSGAGVKQLALRTEELLPLTRRIGTKVLELEAKLPGATTNVINSFGDGAVRYLAKKAHPSDISRLLGYAKHADSQATKELLYQAYKKSGHNGTHFLEKLNWKHIVATGLSTSMIVSAYQVSKGIGDGIKGMLKNNPQFFKNIMASATSPFTMLGIIVFIFLLFRLVLRKRKQ